MVDVSILRVLDSGVTGLHDVGARRLFRTNRITVMHEEITWRSPFFSKYPMTGFSGVR
jgi:hypothetical protein